LQKEYWDTVVAYTISEVKSGRTPNPDVLCNQRVKFGAFLNHIDDSYDKIASGHYAQTEVVGGVPILRRAPDPIKDQTYFLAHLSDEQLSRIIFPIGHLEKAEVRNLAKRFNLPNKARKDSQGICFLGKLKFSEFLKHHLGEQPGDIVELETGKKLAEHTGFWYYTIGQRQGIGLSGGPWYVVKKDPKANIVYISRNYYSEDKERNSFSVTDCIWFGGNAPRKKSLELKMRHGAHLHSAEVTITGAKTADILLAERDQGIAPGQFAVFYDGDICLGSGVIE
jgi:tRNA-specific 2-thiouridylase